MLNLITGKTLNYVVSKRIYRSDVGMKTWSSRDHGTYFFLNLRLCLEKQSTVLRNYSITYVTERAIKSRGEKITSFRVILLLYPTAPGHL